MTTTDTTLVLRAGYATRSEAESAVRRCESLGLSGLRAVAKQIGTIIDDDGDVEYGPSDPVVHVIRPIAGGGGRDWQVYLSAICDARDAYPHLGIFESPDRDAARSDLQAAVIREALAQRM